MLKYLVVSLFIMSSVFGQTDGYVQGEGRFWASDDDSGAFIKDQLVHNAFENVISKELENMGLNKELFWQKYDEKFQNVVQGIEEKLKAQYKAESEPLEGDRLKSYNNALRDRKLKARKRFGKLDSIIQSYSIKKITRSTQNPESRYILVEAKVNRNGLNRIYYSYVTGKKKGEYGTLYLWVNYNIKNSNYADIGVDNEKDFTEVVNSFWLKWFNENKPSNIANVAILDSSKQSRLKDYFKIPVNELESNIPDVFVNSLLLEMDIEITKKGESQKFKEYEFTFSGGSYLLDMQTNTVLTSAYFEPVDQVYRDLEYKDLSTKVANFVYRMPFTEFTKIKSTLSNVVNSTHISKVRLIDFPNMKEVLDFAEILENRGLKYSVNTSLSSFTANHADLMVTFEGSDSDLKSLVSSIKSVKNNTHFQFIDSDALIGVKYSLSTTQEKPAVAP